MSLRRRSAAIAALAALLVSWTAGPLAAFCMPGMAAEATEAAAPAHPHGQMAHGQAMHGGMHHPPPAPPSVPRPADGRAPADAPECPLMAMNSGSCLAAATAPAVSRSTRADLLPADDYPPPARVRDRLLAASLFRPPEA